LAADSELPGRAVRWGTVIAILDIASAMSFWAVYRGVSPLRILQSVAAGLQGKAAFTGGAAPANGGAWRQKSVPVWLPPGPPRRVVRPGCWRRLQQRGGRAGTDTAQLRAAASGTGAGTGASWLYAADEEQVEGDGAGHLRGGKGGAGPLEEEEDPDPVRAYARLAAESVARDRAVLETPMSPGAGTRPQGASGSAPGLGLLESPVVNVRLRSLAEMVAEDPTYVFAVRTTLHEPGWNVTTQAMHDHAAVPPPPPHTHTHTYTYPPISPLPLAHSCTADGALAPARPAAAAAGYAGYVGWPAERW
jgi:hypothetical protein